MRKIINNKYEIIGEQILSSFFFDNNNDSDDDDNDDDDDDDDDQLHLITNFIMESL